MFAAIKPASSPELKDFSALGEAPEYHPAYQSGVSILESFLSQRPRPEHGVYALFAQDPEGRLRYVCSSDRSFDGIRFPEEIER
ncbi:MAG: hypothetical protein LC772_09585 [Chloroflexi bacterium]|nr:hypothetical protein [Chloroflexota bacterium]